MDDMVMILFLCGRHNLELEPHVSPHMSAIRASRVSALAEV